MTMRFNADEVLQHGGADRAQRRALLPARGRVEDRPPHARARCSIWPPGKTGTTTSSPAMRAAPGAGTAGGNHLRSRSGIARCTCGRWPTSASSISTPTPWRCSPERKRMRDLLELALSFEKDSVVFYVGVKDLVPPEVGKEQVDEIIKEEMSSHQHHRRPPARGGTGLTKRAARRGTGGAGARRSAGPCSPRCSAQMRMLAPVRRGRVSHAFDWIEDPRQVVLDYQRTVLPPKARACSPIRRRCSRSPANRRRRPRPSSTTAPYALVGIHPCDLFAVRELDWAYLERHGNRGRALRRRGDMRPPSSASSASPTNIASAPNSGLGRDARRGPTSSSRPWPAGYVVEVLTDRGRDLLAAHFPFAPPTAGARRRGRLARGEGAAHQVHLRGTLAGLS